MHVHPADAALLAYCGDSSDFSTEKWRELVSDFARDVLIPELEDRVRGIAWPNATCREYFIQETAAAKTLKLFSKGISPLFDPEKGSLASWFLTPFVRQAAGRYIAEWNSTKRMSPEAPPDRACAEPDALTSNRALSLVKDAKIKTQPLHCAGLQLFENLDWDKPIARVLQKEIMTHALKGADNNSWDAVHSAHLLSRDGYISVREKLNRRFENLAEGDAQLGEAIQKRIDALTIHYFFVPLDWRALDSLTGWGQYGQKLTSRYRDLLYAGEVVPMPPELVSKIKDVLSRTAYTRKKRATPKKQISKE